MIGALLIPLLLQGSGLEITTSVDRSRVGVSEEVLYTLRAVGKSTAAFRANLPALDGFELIERRERTDIVPVGREIMRAYSLELRLRAEQIGTWSIGPILVEHGLSSAWSGTERVSVTSASPAATSGLEADLVALIPRVPEPRVGGPSVFVVTSSGAVYSGDQVNVLTAAWLPRGLRLRLRQPPTLTPPALPGVWSTPRVSVPGAVASRTVDGEIYDLFVGFQTVYPLNPGAVTIPSARLVWTEPGGRQFAAEDLRRIAESGPVVVEVRDLPAPGRPAGFAGPAARGLRIEYRLGQGAGRAGSVLPVDIVISGAGNLLLWPPPSVTWPAQARVYEEGNESSPRLLGQRLGGSRRFRYAVVPDSAGSLPLPPLEYSYFDPGDGSYRMARAAGIVVPVLDAEPVADRRAPLPLKPRGKAPFAVRVVGLPPVALGTLIALPLLFMAGVLLWQRRRPRPTLPASTGDPAARLDALVGMLVPPSTRGTAEALTAALRRAGFDRDGARRIVTLHLALEAERFGPEQRAEPSAELRREIELALRKLPRELGGHAGLAAAALLLALLWPGGGAAQDRPSGAELYRERQYAAAAQALRAEPASPGRWYNVALAEYNARRDGYAVAALLGARAEAPRDRGVWALWNALAREHETLRRGGRWWLISAEECFALAIALLWLGAVATLIWRRRRTPALAFTTLALAAALAGVALQRERSAPRAVLAGGASLRLSPHGLAPERNAVPAFTVVRLERGLGGWWLVRTPEGARGWVPDNILALTPR